MLKVKETGAFVAPSLAKSDKPYLISQLSPSITEDGQKILHVQILALKCPNKNREYGLAYDIPVGEGEWNTIAEAMHIDPQESYAQHIKPASVPKPIPIPKPAVKVILEPPSPQSAEAFNKLWTSLQTASGIPAVVPITVQPTDKCSQNDSACFGCVDEKSHQYHKGLCQNKECEVCWGKEHNCGHEDCKACHPASPTAEQLASLAKEISMEEIDKAVEQGLKKNYTDISLK